MGRISNLNCPGKSQKNKRLKLSRKNTEEKENKDCKCTGIENGEVVQFIPITDNMRKFVAVQFGLMDSDIKDMPGYIFGGYGEGRKPPQEVFRIGTDGNCFFRAICYILSGSEDRHYEVRQNICDYVEVHY